MRVAFFLPGMEEVNNATIDGRFVINAESFNL